MVEPKQTEQWTPLTLHFTAQNQSTNPYTDNEFIVRFRSPSGSVYIVPGYWDGGKQWRARIAPHECGLWSWSTESRETGLHGHAGEINVNPYTGSQNLRRHGFLKIHNSQRAFAYADGTSFFWLGDTVWTVSSHARLEEWQRYLELRNQQGYNVVQINPLPNWDASQGEDRPPFAKLPSGQYDVDRPNPEYFQYLDRLLAEAAAYGMVPALVGIWFNFLPMTNLNWPFEVERPAAFDAMSAARFTRMLAARYAAYGAVWLVSGDTDLSEQSLAIYDAAAEAILEATPYKPLLTAHMVGGLAASEQLNQRKWLDFHMLQSGHSHQSAERAMRLAVTDRSLQPARPVINGEPCYERMLKGDEPDPKHKIADSSFVRKACWASVLGGASSGITYGAHGLWPWHRVGQDYPMAWLYGEPPTWEEAMHLEGGADIARLKCFMLELPWWELEPIDADEQSSRSWLAASHTCGYKTLLYYMESPGELAMSLPRNGADYEGIWFNPATGETAQAELHPEGSSYLAVQRYPWSSDAVLRLDRIQSD